MADGKWKNVIKAVNRGKQIQCSLCGETGATVGCTHPNCFKSFHFSCGEETGWRFERDSKVFYCDMHRSKASEARLSDCDRLSLRFFRSKHPSAPLICRLCGVIGDDKRAGSILAFHQRNQDVLVHDKCARFTTVVETAEENEGTDDTFATFLRLYLCRKSAKSASYTEQQLAVRSHLAKVISILFVQKTQGGRKENCFGASTMAAYNRKHRQRPVRRHKALLLPPMTRRRTPRLELPTIRGHPTPAKLSMGQRHWKPLQRLMICRHGTMLQLPTVRWPLTAPQLRVEHQHKRTFQLSAGAFSARSVQ